jgi:hypothetical protein
VRPFELNRSYGKIALTLVAELALHLARARPCSQPVDQTSQRGQVGHPERAPASSRHDERIHRDRVRPAHRQRVLHALIIEKERPVLRPVLPHANQQELAATPRMERMSHLDSPLPTIAIRSI